MMLFPLTCRHNSIFISLQFLVNITLMAKLEYWRPGWLSQEVFFSLLSVSKASLSPNIQIQDKKTRYWEASAHHASSFGSKHINANIIRAF